MKHTPFTGLLLGGLCLALTLGSAACGGTANAPPDQNVPAHADLFACGVPLTCDAVCVHIDFSDCNAGTGALDCSGNVWASGMSGTLQLNDRPGPGNWQGDQIMFFLGDGRALVQQRTRECPNLEVGCDFDKLTWQLQEHKICDVAATSATCQPGNCSEFPRVENCMPVDAEWNCEQVKMALSPATP